MCLSNYFKRRKVNTNRIFKTSYVPSKSLQELRGSDQVLKKWMRFFLNKKRKKHQRSSKPKLDIKLQYRKPICYNNIYSRKIAHEKTTQLDSKKKSLLYVICNIYTTQKFKYANSKRTKKYQTNHIK